MSFNPLFLFGRANGLRSISVALGREMVFIRGMEAYSDVQHGDKGGEQAAARLCSAAREWSSKGSPEFALLFASTHFADEFAGILDDLVESIKPKTLVGCSGYGTIGVEREYENQPTLSLLLLRAPGLKVTSCFVREAQIEESTGPGFWHIETDVGPEQPQGILLFADPFSVSIEKLVHELNEAYPNVPIIGGLAAGRVDEKRTYLFEGAKVHKDGALIVFLEGSIRVETVVSQGCEPIGEPLIVTKAERNVIYEIANQPALKALNDAIASLDSKEKLRAHKNIFAGIAMNEYLAEFHRGDFLVRNLLGADQSTGALAVGARLRAGQTIQFQMRDAKAARIEMYQLLTQTKKRFQGKTIHAGLICSCSGRGEGLFGVPDQDPSALAQILGKFPVTGFFCNGEIGPVGSRVFVHGYTCAMALFLNK
jgi:small ligand-binding sensory domain FIST